MFGPVLSLDLLLGKRRGRLDGLRRAYALWLAVQFYYLWASHQLERAIDPSVTGRFLSSYLELFVAQHFVVLLLVTPAAMAGAIVDEKMRRTLSDLLAANVTSTEIVAGKWLGRLTQVFRVAVVGLPFLAVAGGLGHLGLITVLSLVLVSGLVVAGLGAVSILASVRSTHTREAMLRVYVWMALGAGMVWGCHVGMGSGFFPTALWTAWPLGQPAFLQLDRALQCLNPVYVLGSWWGTFEPAAAERLARATLAWATITAGSLIVAIRQLRPVYFRQLAAVNRKRWRLPFGRRPPVDDDVMTWKEQHAESISLWSGFGRLPSWPGRVALFCCGLYVTNTQVLRGTVAFDLVDVLVALFLSLLVGIRASGAVSGERERQTWEALLLTPLDTDQLIRGKFRGILAATFPYLAAYAFPAVALPALAPAVLAWKIPVLVTTLMAMHFLGAIGLWWSVRSETSWRSLLATLATGYGYGTVIYTVSALVSLVLWVGIAGGLALALLLFMGSLSSGPSALLSELTFVVALCAGTSWAFWKASKSYLTDAERWVGEYERIGNSRSMKVYRALRKEARRQIEAEAAREVQPQDLVEKRPARSGAEALP